MTIRFLPSCKESADIVSADSLQKLYDIYAIDAVHHCKCPFCDTESLQDIRAATAKSRISKGM